ncbi:MAG: hypothetical protein JNL86_11720 [Nitrospira sp.]|nr:hypothetical protein [Nitrospira sp.]MCC7472064.1 hypothetical protein [Candidatus Nomurabacteria bacterium]
MRQVIALIGIGCFMVLLQGCAAPAKQAGHERVAFAEDQGRALSDDAFVKKVEQHLDRQDRPGSTLMFR